MAIVWITGASSGIGAALARSAPPGARVVGVARRPPPCGEHLRADLADPRAWPLVGDHVDALVRDERPETAVLLHFAGALGPTGPAGSADVAAYTDSVLLNAAAGQVLGARFLRACARVKEVRRATLVMCSSPAATAPRAGAAQYCAGKAALEQWARAVAIEQSALPAPASVFSVVPYGVDTPMVREAMATPAEELPLGEVFRTAAAADRLAAPDAVAREIWALVARPPAPGAAVAVGAVPS
jgi:NAD(P)-dependent dehydrogenase (short-subunit alcohol dehydrogenase family)